MHSPQREIVQTPHGPIHHSRVRRVENGEAVAECSDGMWPPRTAAWTQAALTHPTIAPELTDRSLATITTETHTAVRSLLFQRGAWT